MSNSGRILALRLLPVRCYRKFWSRRATKCVASLAFLFCIVVVIPRSDPRLYQQMRKSVPRDQINPSSTVESIRSVKALVVEVDKPDIPARRLMALHNCSEHDLLGEMHINPNITPSFEEVENISNHHL
uniref:Uncharacterized protein n=1 Tax=Ciona savignyi TaxID=51511 RepID=H2YQS5_CIOSA